MSWDVLLYNVPSGVTRFEQLESSGLLPLGSKSCVISKLKKVFPDISFSDPNWGYIERPGFSIEFNFGSDNQDPLDYIRAPRPRERWCH